MNYRFNYIGYPMVVELCRCQKVVICFLNEAYIGKWVARVQTVIYWTTDRGTVSWNKSRSVAQSGNSSCERFQGTAGSQDTLYTSNNNILNVNLWRHVTLVCGIFHEHNVFSKKWGGAAVVTNGTLLSLVEMVTDNPPCPITSFCGERSGPICMS